MITIFVSSVKKNAEYAEQLRQNLEVRGHSVWREPPSLTLESILYPRTVENIILGSAAIVLVWSSIAAQSEWIEQHTLFAQQLKKLIVPVLLDTTALPTTLVAVLPIIAQGLNTHVVDQVVSVLPPSGSKDALFTLSEKAAHKFIRERKAAVDLAAQMLQRGEHHEEVLAILEYLVRNDLMMGVREKAQEVLNANNGTVVPPALRSGESRHIFGVRCEKGHVSYFDKRHVCSATRPELRGLRQRAGKELDELHLTCDTCGIEVVACIDCEGYK